MRVWKTVTVVVAVALLAAACGDDPSDVSTDTSATTDGSTTTAEATTTTDEAPTTEAPATIDPASAVGQLRAARSVWDQAHVQSYTMAYTPLCACGSGPVEVRYSQGHITYMSTAYTPVDGMPPGDVPVVETMFAELETAYAGGTYQWSDQVGPADSVEVTYDAEWGYPTHLVIDYDATVEDDQMGWDVVEFEVDWSDRPTTTTTLPGAPTDTIPGPSVGTGTPPDASTIEELRAAVDEQREVWADAGIDDYTLTYLRACYPQCAADLVIEVQVVDGAVAGSRIVSQDGQSSPEVLVPMTVDDLFDLTDDIIHKCEQTCFEFDLFFDRERGFPTTARVDQSRSGFDGFMILGFVSG